VAAVQRTSRSIDINMSNKPSVSLDDGGTVSETSGYNTILKRLIVREDLVALSRRESFQ
jgi:hypothetical protein